MNEPAGTTTISGHASQSRNTRPGARAQATDPRTSTAHTIQAGSRTYFILSSTSFLPRSPAARRFSPVETRQEKRRASDHHDRPWTLVCAPVVPVRTPVRAVERTGDTEAAVVVTVSGCVPVAVRGAEVPRVVVPGTAAQHTLTGERSGPRDGSNHPSRKIARRSRQVSACSAWDIHARTLHSTDIPHIPSKFVEIVPLSHRQGNCIPYAAIRWHDFGNRPALGRPLGHFSRHPDTPLLSLSPRRRFPRPTPERVFVADHQSSSGFSGTGPSAPPPQPIGT